MRCIILAAGLLAPIAFPAYASGGFDCVAEDGNLTFAASGIVGRGVVTPIMNFQASAVIAWREMPVDLRKPDMSSALKQSWWQGDDLKLHFYAEREGNGPFASLELLIETSLQDDGTSYAGGYVMTAYEVREGESRSVEVSGQVTCSAE